MAARIPPSLAWLIDKRARIDGELKKARQATDTAMRLIKDLKVLERDLAAVDRVLTLHTLNVDKTLIEPRLSHSKRLELPRGWLTRSLLEIIAAKMPDPVPSKAILEEVATRFPQLWTDPDSKHQLYESVRYRLKNLARDGVLQRHVPPRGSRERRWSLVPESNTTEST